MLTPSSVYLSLDSTRVALHDSQLKMIIVYVILGLNATPSVQLLFKTSLLASFPLSLNQLSSDWMPLIKRFGQQVHSSQSHPSL